jgi:hypothetical protein
MPPVTPSAMRLTSTSNSLRWSQLPTPKDSVPKRWELEKRQGVGGWELSSIFSTFRRSTSRCAIVIFFSPVSRGTAPASNCRARLPATTTNSNRFSLGMRSTWILSLVNAELSYAGANAQLPTRCRERLGVGSAKWVGSWQFTTHVSLSASTHGFADSLNVSMISCARGRMALTRARSATMMARSRSAAASSSSLTTTYS